MKNIFRILVISIVIFFPFAVFATIENIDNAGFVPGPIWFSKYPVFVDDEVRIYTALYNNSQYNISGELHFFNNENLIGNTDFEMLAGSGATDVWIDWVALKGDIEIGAEIKNVSIINSQKEAVSDIDFKDTQIAKSKIFIDFDNDGDGIGNIADDDDDNDGVNDLTEIAEGTNPFEVDHEISTSSPADEAVSIEKESEKAGFLDKVDDSVMGFLNKITQNKIDEFVDNFSESQVIKLESRKEDIKNRISENFENSISNIVKLDTIKSSSTASNTEKNLETVQSANPKEIEDIEIKNKISLFFKNFFSKSYLFIVNAMIFLLNHTFFLFLFIFFLIYLSIKKVIRFFVG